MGRFWKRSLSLLALAAAVGLSCLSPLQAARPGGGGGGGETTTPYSIVELPIITSGGGAVSQPHANGIVTVVGNGTEFGYVSAAYVQMDSKGRTIVASGLLPEPTDGPPDDFDFGSNATDVNSSGIIVGGADIDDPTIPALRRGVPIRWIPAADGAYHDFDLLPMPEGDDWGSVAAINEAGAMVGNCYRGNNFEVVHPVLWNAAGTTVIDLNTLIPGDSGWTLINASDINSSGLIVGSGTLGGVERGFVLDPVTGAITPVPLAPGATTNEAWKINDFGDVVGRANDDIVGGGPYPQGGWGFFWNDSATTATLLPSARSGAAYVRGLNNSAELVGDSWLADDQVINDPNDSGEMTLWRPNSSGFSITKLGTQVPTKPVWYLRYGFDINDDGLMLGFGRKFVKGQYTWMGVLVVPNP